MPDSIQLASNSNDQDFTFSLDLNEVVGGRSILELMTELIRAHYDVLRANRAMVGQTFIDPDYAKAVEIADAAMLQLIKAKWWAGGVTGNYNGIYRSEDRDLDATRAWEAARSASEICSALKRSLMCGEGLRSIKLPKPALTNQGTETLFVDGIPIVPSICPVVFLSGSHADMGAQYIQQLLDIYGPIHFEIFANLDFNEERMAHLRNWEAELKAHTPDLIDFCKGWERGAKAAGLEMSYWHVLHLWTGADLPAPSADEGLSPFSPDIQLPLATYFAQGLFFKQEDVQKRPGIAEGANPLENCSGICAWGEATASGKLRAASSTDHDCWMQATIVAYPDEGAAYIYTPFSITGWLPGMGSMRFAGHPGMNEHGLAYVHHGGETHMMEPAESWGYGVPRGASTIHTLLHASSAEQARDIQLSMPIGDVGTVLGAPGGQWADDDYGFILESREITETHPMGLLREGTIDHDGKQHDILYAGNSSLHPDACGNNHGYEPGELDYNVERGWHTRDASKVQAESMKRIGIRMTALNGERVRTFFRYAIPASGNITTDWMFDLYRTPSLGYPGVTEWDKKMEEVRNGESKIVASPAKRLNAFTSVMEPSNDGDGLYHACIGPLSRDLPPGGSGHEYYYYDETNAHWTLRLAKTPTEMVEDARTRAETLIEEAISITEPLKLNAAAKKAINALINNANTALQQGHKQEGLIASQEGDEASGTIAKSLRRFTIAQVRARQVIQSVHRPAGLKLLTH